MTEKKQYKFETIQVHAGQEEPDSATGAGLCPFMPPRRMFLKTAPRRRGGLPFQRAGTFIPG